MPSTTGSEAGFELPPPPGFPDGSAVVIMLPRGRRLVHPFVVRRPGLSGGPGCPQHPGTSTHELTAARRTTDSDADACRSRTGYAVLRGQIPPVKFG